MLLWTKSLSKFKKTISLWILQIQKPNWLVLQSANNIKLNILGSIKENEPRKSLMSELFINSGGSFYKKIALLPF